ncbi:hypothetical protein F5Y17DRAFT_453160 [Xylariaceae sp. FL0594]|nr:hypothetical protein F5Y17DRAFT_453160 [Xylariaceae sp. FL0594]
MASLNITTTPNPQLEQRQNDTIHVTTPVRTSGRTALPRTRGVPPVYREILPNPNKHSTTTGNQTPQPKQKRVASVETAISTGQEEDTVLQAESDSSTELPAEQDPKTRKRKQNAAAQKRVQDRRRQRIKQLEEENARLRDQLDSQHSGNDTFQGVFAQWAGALKAEIDRQMQELDAGLDQRLSELEVECGKAQEALVVEGAKQREMLKAEFAEREQRLAATLSDKQIALSAEFDRQKADTESENAKQKEAQKAKLAQTLEEVQTKQAEWRTIESVIKEKVSKSTGM